jgi:hypothetical protein
VVHSNATVPRMSRVLLIVLCACASSEQPPDAGGELPAGSGPSIGGCPIFPADDPWNEEVV